MTARNVVPSPKTPIGGVVRHGAAIYDDPRHDPYWTKHRYSEPTKCKDCGAVFHNGRWRWGAAPGDAHLARCPACRRIHDQLPAGTVTLGGLYVDAHRNDLAGIVRNTERREREEHPLSRVMGIADVAGRMVVTTTDIHLPRRIGEALRAAHDGTLEFRFADDEYHIDVQWWRD